MSHVPVPTTEMAVIPPPSPSAPGTAAHATPAHAIAPSSLAGRVVLLYIVFGALWIVLSDRALGTIGLDAKTIEGLQTFKGCAFIAVTAGLLYVTLRGRLQSLKEAVLARQETERAAQQAAATAVQELTRIRAALEEETSRRRSLFENSPDGVTMLDPATLGFSEFNDAACRSLGYTRTEFAALTLDAIECAPNPTAIRDMLDKVNREGRAEYESLHRTKSGGHVEVHVTTQLVEMLGRRYYQCICRDITPRKRMETALRESEERFRELVETVREVFWVSDAESRRLLYVSPAFEKIWGRSCSELYESWTPWTNSIRADDRERVVHAMATRQLTGEYDETYRIVRPDGSLCWVRDRAYPVKDRDGNVLRIVGAAEDITERKKLEDQFLHAQRLEAIGTLASGVAHDLNNILAPLFMIAPMLKTRVTEPADVQMVEIVERSVTRGANVVRQLLTFSRGIEGTRGPLQPRHLIKEMASIMSETFPRSIGISHSVPADLWSVVGDATQLHQVLMNLCVNARDAMPTGGRLSLAAQNITVSGHDLRMNPHAKPGPYVMVSVVDTGHGIPPEIRSRIFDPFFTTKEFGKGTGLGLCTVLGIVKSHGGFVTVDTEPGRGTAFRVYLPADAAATAPVNSSPVVDLPLGKGELVLIVDDEPAVRDTMQRVLEKQRYRVLTAGNGRQALDVFIANRNDIAAVVTDLMMPHMSGLSLVYALREFSPNLPIIAATGLQHTEDREALAAVGVVDILSKPYTPAELVKALQRELTKPAAPA